MVKKTAKRILNLGVGFSEIGQDKIKELSKDLEKKYDLSSKEGKKLATDLINTTQKTSKQIVDAISDQFQFMLKNTLGVKKGSKLKRKILKRKK